MNRIETGKFKFSIPEEEDRIILTGCDEYQKQIMQPGNVRDTKSDLIRIGEYLKVNYESW